MDSSHALVAPRDAGPGAARTVLIVLEDDLVRDLIASGLRRAGCYPLPVADTAQARRIASQVLPDAVIVDAGDGDTPAARWAHELAQTTGPRRVRMVLLSDAGEPPWAADLCARKPIEPREFVRNVLRLLRPERSGGRGRAGARTSTRPVRRGGLEIDRDTPGVRVLRGGQWHTIDLHRAEHRLLLALAESSPRPLDREALRAAAWGDDPVALRTVDQNVRRLRDALARADAGEVVHTVPGLGYRLEPRALDGDVRADRAAGVAVGGMSDGAAGDAAADSAAVA